MNEEPMPTDTDDARVGEALRALPQISPSPEFTTRLAALATGAGATADVSPRPRPGRWFALAASVAVAVWITLARLAPEHATEMDPGRITAANGAAASTAAAGEARAIDALMAQSQYLETVLDAVPRRGRVQRVGTASTITALEDRVAFIDAQLSAPELAADAGGREVLWRQRVGLMNTLVSLQAPQAGMVAL